MGFCGDTAHDFCERILFGTVLKSKTARRGGRAVLLSLITFINVIKNNY